MTSSIEISYDLDRNDFWAFNKFAIWRMPTARRNLIANILAPPVAGAVVMFVLGLPALLVVPISLIILVMFGLLMLIFTRRQIMNLPSGSPGFLGKHTITIEPKGFREETAVNNSIMAWSGVTDIAENADYIFLFIETHMAHVIPKRAFKLKEESLAFIEAARKFWNEGV